MRQRNKKAAVIIAAVLLVAAIAAMIIPMWVATAGIDLPPAGLASVLLMIVGCFAVGGGLMFLIFLSARSGHDEAVHHGAGAAGRSRQVEDRTGEL